MHVDHELVEFVLVDEQDYEEVIEKYKEEILVQEGAPEPFVADFVDPPPAQGKPRGVCFWGTQLGALIRKSLVFRYGLSTV